MRSTILKSAVALAVLASGVSAAYERDKFDRHDHHAVKIKLVAKPFVFVGTADQCGGTPGSRIVTSAWLQGLGLPDNLGTNGVAGTRRDPHDGLLLNKNGPTADCSAAGAEIVAKGFEGSAIITELGFDVRNGTHCNNGAPRFNVTTEAGFTYFCGCARGAQAPAPQDPAWTRVRFAAGRGVCDPAAPTNPPFVFGETPVTALAILFDEGTTPVLPGVSTGLAVIDNIDINGALITDRKGTLVKFPRHAHARVYPPKSPPAVE